MTTNTANVSVTSNAAQRIAALASQEGENAVLRVSVRGGGCSGFSYDFSFDNAATADDVEIEKDGVKVLIDAVSLMYLEGSEIDFVDDLMGQSFRITNPNASSSCGCGTSFSI